MEPLSSFLKKEPNIEIEKKVELLCEQVSTLDLELKHAFMSLNDLEKKVYGSSARQD